MATKAEIEAAAMALAHKHTPAQWDALFDHEQDRYREDAGRALRAADTVRDIQAGKIFGRKGGSDA